MSRFGTQQRPDIYNSRESRFIPGPGQYSISENIYNYYHSINFGTSRTGFELIDGKLFNQKNRNDNPGPGSYDPKVSYNSSPIKKNNNQNDSSQIMNSSDSLSSYNIISKDQFDNSQNQIIQQDHELQQQYIFDQDQEIFL